MKQIITVSIILLCQFLTINAGAAELLGSWDDVGGGGGSGIYIYQGQFTPSSLSFSLVFNNYGSVLDPNTCVLESPHFSSGATATFDYNSSNTPDFGVFVQHLTNNSNEILTSFVYPFDKDGVRQGGGGGGNFESYLFPTFENLASWQPEFVRLIAESVAIQENPPYWDPQGRWIYGYHYSYGVRWEIWGTDVPTTCVPEPSTMLLLGSGLIGLLELRRKSKK